MNIPLDSPINQLDDLKFETYFVNAVKNIEDINALLNPENYVDPLYSSFYCNVHTLEWYENNTMMKEAVASADALLTEVTALLVAYSESLDENHLQQINSAMNDLTALKTAQNDYNELIQAIQTLNVLKQAYLDVLADSGSSEPDEG